jgi:hypothetical protein
MTGALSRIAFEGWPAAFCRNEEDDCCLPNASGHEVSFEDGSFFLDRPELPSFHGLAGQCFSGVDGTPAFSTAACFASFAPGASRVEECSWVFVGKKSVVSTLEKLGF